MENGKSFTKSCNARDTTAVTVNYVYPDEPNNTLGWSERQCINSPFDRRIVMSTQDFTLVPNSTPVKYELAVLNTPLGSSNVDFSVLKSMADYVIANPNGCSSLAPTAINNVSLSNDISIFPNPTSSSISIKWTNNDLQTITLLNTLGQSIETKNTNAKKETSFNLNNLSNGIYFIQLKTATETVTKKFTKN